MLGKLHTCATCYLFTFLIISVLNMYNAVLEESSGLPYIPCEDLSPVRRMVKEAPWTTGSKEIWKFHVQAEIDPVSLKTFYPHQSHCNPHVVVKSTFSFSRSWKQNAVTGWWCLRSAYSTCHMYMKVQCFIHFFFIIT